MTGISNYAIIEELSATPHSVVYRARKDGWAETVILKTLRAADPSPAQIARFKHEYELIRRAALDGVIRVHDIIDHDGTLALVMEDFGGVCLKEVIHEGLDTGLFLDLAARLARILGDLHREGISHRDIKPGNILYNRQQDILKITDFGIAAELTGRINEINNPSVIEGTLAYMSPEQTGRINCPVDYRTDLYSLGITFYEMLTGAVPFISKDPLEIIHCHIAKAPMPPRQLNVGLPEVLSGIVLKLLAKVPEERYQNSYGLMYDLEQCRRRLKDNGRIDPFELACRDVSLKFNIPQVIMGRDAELALLNEACARAIMGGVAVVRVTGEPGIGKSALVNEIRKPVIARQGNFIAGKYDQLRKSVPYSAIIQAFQGLTRQVLTESADSIRQWRERLLEVFGPNGRIITDAIPEIELIVGRQPEIPELGFEESQNRFQMVFKNFIRVFAADAHPLVLFLDDLQWADSASLNLIRAVTTDRDLSHFLLIGAYRDNEVGAHHPLHLMLEEIHKKQVIINTLKLSALGGAHVNAIIANLLRCASNVTAALADVVHTKTLGNPFFVIQFLKTLYENKYLIQDADNGWQWDTERIRAMQVTDNVVDFMAANIAALPRATRALIEVCACIGNRFDIETVAATLAWPMDEVLYAMDELIHQGLINFSKNQYRFHHDRIQEAAYGLVPSEERARRHYRIGHRLLEITPPDGIIAKIFYIADHFNNAVELIRSDEEKKRAAELNLQAGIKAKEATAYAAAAEYLKAGMALLPGHAWTTQYELAFSLHLQRMECEYLNRNFAESERLFAGIEKNAKTRVDLARAATAMIELYTNIGKLREAIDLGVDTLKRFDVHLSRKGSKLAFVKELVLYRMMLRKFRIEKILDHPMMTDEELKWVCELYCAMSAPAYYSDPILCVLNSFGFIKLFLSHGLTRASAYALISSAVIIGSVLGNYTLALRVGETALKLNEKLGAKSYGAKMHLLFAYMILPWVRPLKECLEYYRKGYQLGLDSGDFVFCGHCINGMNMSRLLMGDNLDEVLTAHAQYKDFVAGIKDPFILTNYLVDTQACLNLKGLTESPLSLSTLEFNHEEHFAAIREQGNGLNIFFNLLAKERCHYLFGAYEEAYHIGFEADMLLETPRGTNHIAEHIFYRCLTLLAVYPGKRALEKFKIRFILKKHKRKMKQWAQACPANYAHKHHLIAAETFRVNGRFEDATQSYQRAIASAREHGYTNIEAIANERAALFYLSKGLEAVAATYMCAAHRAYEHWGATAKVTAIEKRYPALIVQQAKALQAADPFSTATASSTGTTTTLLDLSSIMKASQTLSSEIRLERVLQNILHMAVVNAGAQRGFFILNTDGALTIEAAEEEGREEIQVMQSIPLTDDAGIATAIVHYVHRSGQDVILGNAVYEGAFTNDPHIVAHRCKSVLCTPIMNKGQISGILYMENNLTANTFTPERLELLRLLSGQAAISLENARLFGLATTDGLTKLFVHRYFHLLLDQEIARARRYGQSFSLIMADIDNFKHFNDTYGHQLGDEVLRIVARTIKKNTRTVDIAARYGGEEFVLILPETDTSGALTAAEKIRKAVEQTEIPNGTQKLHVAISLGIATFPLHAGEKEALIRSADNALYAAKRAGKNRVCVGAKISP